MPEDGAAPRGMLGINRRPSAREWRRAVTFFVVGTIGITLMLLFIHPQPSLLPPGTAAAPISLDAAAGGHVALPAAASGRPYVVEFFEAGCAHCQQVAAQLCDEKVPVFAVDAAKDSADAIAAYRTKYAPQCSYPMLVDPSVSAAKAYAVTVVPTVYVVKNGKITYAGAGLEGISGVADAVARAQGG